MQELRDYYRNRLKIWVGVIVGLAVLYRQFAVPAIDDWYRSHNWKLGEAWLKGADSVLVGLLFLLGEWFIRTKLWKFERREWNFSGLWQGKTTYAGIEKGSADVNAQTFVPFSVDHEVKIDQDCFSISIKPTSKYFASWYSIAMTIRSQDEIAYAYEVKYTDRKKFPDKAIGYEQMNVVKTRKRWLGIGAGRPVGLSGTFAHCAQGQAPVYNGSVTFDLVG